MLIHKEGHKIIILSTSVLILINLLLWYFVPLLVPIPAIGGVAYRYFLIIILFISTIILIFLLLFFRNPHRNINKNENHILSPADGKIIAIVETFEPEYFKDKRLKISIFMTPLSVHLNRYPMGGVIEYIKYHKGRYLVAFHPKSSELNEHNTIVIQSNNKIILLRQIAGIIARRIVSYCNEGDVIQQGDELGFIKFGSRLDLFLPLNTKINILLNQKVKAGITIIAEL